MQGAFPKSSAGCDARSDQTSSNCDWNQIQEHGWSSAPGSAFGQKFQGQMDNAQCLIWQERSEFVLEGDLQPKKDKSYASCCFSKILKVRCRICDRLSDRMDQIFPLAEIHSVLLMAEYLHLS
jgi:hypothetical protein